MFELMHHVPSHHSAVEVIVPVASKSDSSCITDAMQSTLRRAGELLTSCGVA